MYYSSISILLKNSKIYLSLKSLHVITGKSFFFYKNTENTTQPRCMVVTRRGFIVNFVPWYFSPVSAEVVVDGRFGAGTGPIWMDDVICSATETRLSDCQFGNWNNSDCTHQEDVGVICPVSTGVSPSTQRPTTTPSPVVPGTGNCKPLSNRNVCKVDEISFGNFQNAKFNDLALGNSLPNDC